MKKGEKRNINVRHQKGDITTDSTDINKTIAEYYEHLH